MSVYGEVEYLVTGASGALGGLTVKALLEEQHVPASKIAAVSRTAESLSAFADLGVQMRVADFDLPETISAAFAGARNVLIVSTNDLGTGKRLAQHKNAVEAAKSVGVKHLFYTSLPDPETSHILFAPDHAGTEAAIKASGLAYTLLRNNWYAENLLMAVPGALASGKWYTAAGHGAVAYLGRAEYASAAAAALVRATEFVNATLTLTGAEALTTEELAKKISAATGKPLTVVPVPLDAIVEGLKQHGFPQDVATVFASIDTSVELGELAGISTDFVTLTGRPQQPFDAWLAANVSLFLG